MTPDDVPRVRLTRREQRVIARFEAEIGSRVAPAPGAAGRYGPRLGPVAVLVAGLVVLVVGAMAMSVTVTVLGITLGLIALLRPGHADTPRPGPRDAG